MNTSEMVVNKNINDIVPNKYQPRQYFDEKELSELAESIKNYGIINPILVRQNGDKYEIIAGERRYRAAKMCGLTEIPVIVKNIDDKQSAELALIENLHRQDLTAIEAARSYDEILKMGNYTQTDLAAKLGVSQSSIANKMRLLTLPEEIQQAVVEKKISERHARCLLDITEKEKQLELLERIIDEKLTVKETEELIEISNTSDEDIENAIKDIMKSLNIKEEKESDNDMNNGNFFPTYDNNMTQNTNLNGNVPTMNTPVTPQENVMPTFMSSPASVTSPETPLINPNLESNEPIMPQQGINQMSMQNPTPEINPIPTTPSFASPITNMEQPSVPNEVQDFTINPSEPISIENTFDTPIPEPPIEPTYNPVQEPVTPLPAANTDDFLFTNPTPAPENINESFYEVPVNVSPVIETPSGDRYNEVINLLSSNGISYKSYSNDTGHCIIIEI